MQCQSFLYRKKLSQSKLLKLHLLRNYHSYPDPNDRPIITSTRSEFVKRLSKSGEEYQSLQKFKMTSPFINLPSESKNHKLEAPKTNYTKLSNGLLVASQEVHGLMSSFSLILNTGSAFEIQNKTVNNEAGVTHMIEQSAFRSTTQKSHQEVMTEVEQLGGMVQCLTSRENIMYCIDILRENSERALEILADAVLLPVFTEDEIEESRQIMGFIPQELPAEILSRDAAQKAAYLDGNLSNHHFAPLENISNLNALSIHRFREKFYYGSNCVLSGAGIDHDYFVDLAQKKFGSLPSTPTTKASRPKSKYTGGMVKSERELKEPFVRLSLAFEIGGWHDPTLVHACVLQQLLGGGSSFSAGGPGKGMYSRLYRDILNRNHWVEAAESFISVHDESGILGIDGACQPTDLPQLFRVFFDQLIRLTVQPVEPIELSRAKNMLKSTMLTQLESRLVLCEDIGKQFITYNKREPSHIVCEKIDAVTAEDIVAVARRMFQSDPTIGSVGADLSSLPSYEQIKSFCDQYKAHYWSQAKIGKL